MKKEHMLLAGAGGIALMYMLSKGDGAAPMSFGGGGALGLDTITTETITTPAGGDGVGSILLPPPDPGRFFDAPAWVKPNGGAPTPAVTPTKKERVTIEKPFVDFYRKEAAVAALPTAQADVYTGMRMAGLKMAGVLPTVKPKKDKIIEKPISYYEKIPGTGFVVGAKRLKSFLGDIFF